MPSPAEILRAMADRIDRNDEADFGGCVVVIAPPDPNTREVVTIEILVVDPARNLANFWSVAAKQTEITAAEVMAAHTVSPLGGYR
jgi:hypothetical protein